MSSCLRREEDDDEEFGMEMKKRVDDDDWDADDVAAEEDFPERLRVTSKKKGEEEEGSLPLNTCFFLIRDHHSRYCFVPYLSHQFLYCPSVNLEEFTVSTRLNTCATRLSSDYYLGFLSRILLCILFWDKIQAKIRNW